MAIKKKYMVAELKNVIVNGSSYLAVIRKAMRTLIKNAKSKKKDLDIYLTFKNITLTITEVDGDGVPIPAKECVYIINIVPNTDSKKSLYYDFEYNIEVYKRLRLI